MVEFNIVQDAETQHSSDGVLTTEPMPFEENEHDEGSELDKELAHAITELEQLRGVKVYPLFLGQASIENSTVEDVFDDLYEKLGQGNERLGVMIDSSGGDIHAAYHLALLIRKFAVRELNFIVPRWAKSAATLLVCAGNKIYMGPISELGPLDPQITQMNPLERRLEHFSPLHMEATLDLIRSEFRNGNDQLANGPMC